MSSFRSGAAARRFRPIQIYHPPIATAGPAILPDPDHVLWATWAADCADRVLAQFESRHPGDDRPRKAIAAGRGWARGEVAMAHARAAAFASHAAARSAEHPAARAAARAAGHAAATAHVARHAPHAATYAVAAATADDPRADAAVERAWQRHHLPEHLRKRAYRSPKSQFPPKQ